MRRSFHLKSRSFHPVSRFVSRPFCEASLALGLTRLFLHCDLTVVKVKDTTRADEKLRELILHICIRSEDDEAFGAVKLNKLLFFSDFHAFLRLGKPITGQ